MDDRFHLTKIGQQLGRLPCDPRVGRMLLAAHEHNVLGDVLVIAAALESQDVRLRPPGHNRPPTKPISSFVIHTVTSWFVAPMAFL